MEGYDIGAKTGTAEKLPRGNGKYLLSYIGYAPQNNPEVVVYVVIDEPNTAVQDDSSLVLGLSQKIMSEAFPYLGITTIAQAGKTLRRKVRISAIQNIRIMMKIMRIHTEMQTDRMWMKTIHLI